MLNISTNWLCMHLLSTVFFVNFVRQIAPKLQLPFNDFTINLML